MNYARMTIVVAMFVTAGLLLAGQSAPTDAMSPASSSSPRSMAVTSQPTSMSSYGEVGDPALANRELIVKSLATFKSGRFLDCHRAEVALRGLGPAVAKPLSDAIADGTYPPQAIARIKDILAWSRYPLSGAVFRKVYEVPADDDFSDGDIVTAVDGKSITDLGTLRAIVPKRTGGKHKFTVWRDGKIIEVNASIEPISGGFRTWPDDLAIYREYSARGKWDLLAEDAIRGIDGRDRQDKFKAAWSAGCTDAFFLAKWIEHLRQNGMPDKSEELLALQKDAVDGSPGGLTKYGWGPLHAACTLIQRSKRDQAQALIEGKLDEGQKVGAWQGVAVLARYYISLRAAESYQEAMKAWGQYKDLALATSDENAPDIIPMLAHLVVVNEGIDKAMEFIAALPPSKMASDLKDYYAIQLGLAENNNDDIPPNKVAIYSSPTNLFLRKSYSSRASYVDILDSPKLPGRLEFKIRMVIRWPFMTNSNYLTPAASVVLAYGGHFGGGDLFGTYGSDNEVGFWMNTDGSVRFYDYGVTKAYGEGCLYRTYELRKWHDVAIDILPHSVRMYLDGNLMRDIQLSDTRGPCSIKAIDNGGGWELSDIRYYAYTDEKFDNEAICKLWDQFGKAVSSAPDVEQACAARDGLKNMLAGVKQAKGYLDMVDTGLDQFEQIMSKDGFQIDSKESLDLLLKSSRVLGNVEYKDDAMVITRGTKRRWGVGFESPMYLPDNFQVTGVLEANRCIEDSVITMFWWSSSAWVETEESLFLEPLYRRLWFGPKYFYPPNQTPPPNVKRMNLDGPIPFCIRVKDGKSALFLNFGAKPDLTRDFIWRDGQGFSIVGYDFDVATELRISKLKFSHLPKEVALDEPLELPTPPMKASSQPTSAEAATSRSTATSSPVDW